METLRVALIGFGTVGKGIYRTIQTHQDKLNQILGKRVEISVILVKNKHRHVHLHKDVPIETNIETITDNDKIDVVFEAIVGIEPAFTYLKQCSEAGKHIITANKEMFAHFGGDLLTLAKHFGVQVGYEATVAGGIPIIQTIKQLLSVNRIHRVEAILNVTTNYILTTMRKEGKLFSEALRYAQTLGYAEADPTNDIEGFDALYKLMILSQLIFNDQPDWKDVVRLGIQDITEHDIKKASCEGKRIRHIATVAIESGHITASVKPIFISEAHPFFSVEGVDNAVRLETNLVGSLTFIGPGAGALPTASAMMEDLCMI